MTENTKNTAPKMATFEAICAEIKAERNRSEKHAAADAYSLIYDDYSATRRAFLLGNATEEEKLAAKAKEQTALEALKREQESNTNHRLRAAILTENAKQAFLAQYIGKICEIWNRYEGKPHGEKTAEKIREEIHAATGYRAYIRNKYSDQLTIEIYPDRKTYGDNITIGCESHNRQRATDDDNRILQIKPEWLCVWYCGEYVHNIGAHIKALKKAHADAEKALEKAREAFCVYNDLTRGKMNRASIYEGKAPHQIIGIN